MHIDVRARFAELHADGTFLMPNPWDVGSARILTAIGFPALATTSSGYALALGKRDQQVTLEELLAHSRALAGAVPVPLNVDSERCFADSLGGVTDTVRAIAETGAAGCSIEDYDPDTGTIDPIGVATERVGAAAEAATGAGLTLTARAENHLYGIDDLEDTIERLRAYRRAGAGVVYAPGLASGTRIDQVVRAVEAPVNVLLLPEGPTVDQLAHIGVRRVSTGGALARSAYNGLVDAAVMLHDQGRIARPDATAGGLMEQALA